MNPVEQIATKVLSETDARARMRACLGRRSAVAEIWPFKFSGFFAWWLWRTIYLFKLPGLERKLRVAMDWTLDLFFRRDIVLLKVFMKKTDRIIPLIVPESAAATTETRIR